MDDGDDRAHRLVEHGEPRGMVLGLEGEGAAQRAFEVRAVLRLQLRARDAVDLYGGRLGRFGELPALAAAPAESHRRQRGDPSQNSPSAHHAHPLVRRFPTEHATSRGLSGEGCG